VALVDSSTGALTDTFEYWPYGEVRSRTGTTPTPFQYVGTLGYYTDLAGRLYVRARHYLTQTARWLTVDPLWPRLRAYDYVGSRPNVFADPSGLSPACVAFGVCAGAAALAAILGCLGAPGGMLCCMASALASSPGLQAMLLVCAGLLIACAGPAILPLLPKPLPVPVGGLAGGVLGAGGRGGSSGGGTCKEDCEEEYYKCIGRKRPGCPHWVSPCDECRGRCLIDGSWPTDSNCNYWKW
jgi:RHS repeat-associated protein